MHHKDQLTTCRHGAPSCQFIGYTWVILMKSNWTVVRLMFNVTSQISDHRESLKALESHPAPTLSIRHHFGKNSDTQWETKLFKIATLWRRIWKALFRGTKMWIGGWNGDKIPAPFSVNVLFGLWEKSQGEMKENRGSVRAISCHLEQWDAESVSTWWLHDWQNDCWFISVWLRETTITVVLF